jgi:hypothetical protein
MAKSQVVQKEVLSNERWRADWVYRRSVDRVEESDRSTISRGQAKAQSDGNQVFQCEWYTPLSRAFISLSTRRLVGDFQLDDPKIHFDLRQFVQEAKELPCHITT